MSGSLLSTCSVASCRSPHSALASKSSETVALAPAVSVPDVGAAVSHCCHASKRTARPGRAYRLLKAACTPMLPVWFWMPMVALSSVTGTVW